MRERLRAVPSPRSARLGCAPPARVCMADCIRRKLLYLIGLYPALITTNSQSLRTALLAPVTLQNQQAKKKKKHSLVLLWEKRTRGRRMREQFSEWCMQLIWWWFLNDCCNHHGFARSWGQPGFAQFSRNANNNVTLCERHIRVAPLWNILHGSLQSNEISAAKNRILPT